MATNLLLSPEIQLTYNRKLLSRFRTKVVFNKFGDQDGIPERGGVAMSWRKMETIRPVAVASSSWPADATYTQASAALLTEGTFYTPLVVASWAQTTATVQQYGQAAYLSEWNNHQALDPQVPNYVSQMGHAA